jgi:hypothetical protein
MENKIIKALLNLGKSAEKMAYREAYNNQCIELAKEKGIEDANKKYGKEVKK